METMSLLGMSACCPQLALRDALPFAVADIDRNTIPPLLRRRSSQATQMAFSAATAACQQARRSAAALPAIFASVAGEIQTTDGLCTELVKADGVISPSAFHNSVQNTVAGYWSIARQCTQPATALAAGFDTFAMALLEAWCQLACQGGELLLVAYDEVWPSLLDPGRGDPAFCCALVLAAGAVDGAIATVGRPERGDAGFPEPWRVMAEKMPILAALPFLSLVTERPAAKRICALSIGQACWQVALQAKRI